MTAVTIQSNKIVLNELKDNEALLEPSHREKPNKLFGPPNTKQAPWFWVHAEPGLTES